VVYTYNSSTKPPFKTPSAAAFQADFVTGQGLGACLSYFDETGQTLDAVINCVAISQPAACELDPEKARAINIPTTLLEALTKKYQNKQEIETRTTATPLPLLIHLSTDQVYDGTKSFSKEETDPANPINQYGKSKLAAEEYIQSQWPNHVILRSSLIYGKEPPALSVGRPLFIQFVDDKLAFCQPTSFFCDEWRSAVYVEDIIRVCRLFIEAHCSSVVSPEKFNGVFNMGGPERLSRVDIAKLVGEVRGHANTESIILEVPSASIPRGVASPSDISMDISKLEATLNELKTILETASGQSCVEEFKFTKFRDALREIFDIDT
jgi:dTDP-4-dehydrorhamnose reductase